jgi:hypothetical protein
MACHRDSFTFTFSGTCTSPHWFISLFNYELPVAISLLACWRASAAIIRNLQLLYLYSQGTDMHHRKHISRDHSPASPLARRSDLQGWRYSSTILDLGPSRYTFLDCALILKFLCSFESGTNNIRFGA